MTRRPFLAIAAVAAGLFVGALAVALQQDWSAVELGTVEVADGIYMFTGPGGNIGLSVGEDGAFLIDDQFAPLNEQLVAAVAAVSDSPVRYVVNTHWHGDHTGGNEPLGEAGAMIVAHENVRMRMNPEEFGEVMGRSQQAPPAALPVVTFTDRVTYYWNGTAIRIQHVDNAHTDGDAIVWFSDAGVLHMGDTFFNGMYPFIDVDSGGNINGIIEMAATLLEQMDESVKIIPGHGDLAGKSDLQAYHDLLVLARDRVQVLIDDRHSLESIIERKPMAEHDHLATSFVTPERFLTAIFRSLTDG